MNTGDRPFYQWVRYEFLDDVYSDFYQCGQSVE
jgi:hypothetical protein